MRSRSRPRRIFRATGALFAILLLSLVSTWLKAPFALVLTLTALTGVLLSYLFTSW